MKLTTSDEWITVDDGFDSETQIATTNDPRVVAVIKREPDYPREFFLDGDMINPTYYYNYWDATHQGGDRDDEVARAFAESRRRFRYREHSDRFMRIFYGVEYAEATAPGDRSGTWIIFSTPAFREECGFGDDHDAKADAKQWAEEVQRWLDGDVWSVGYATLEGRVLDGGDINYPEWDEVICCGGFVGEEHAKGEAASFGYDAPDLPELMDLEV